MQSQRTSPRISAESIRQHFLRSKNPAPPSFSAEQEAPGEMTPAAKFIARETKKLLGQTSALQNTAERTEEQLFDLVRLVENNENEELSERERTAVVAALRSSLDHYDLLTPLIENTEINDIIVRAYNDISVQTGRVNVQTDLRFADSETYKSFVENLLKRAGKACTLATPVIDAALDPHIRACVTHESFSPPGSGPMLTLRIARHRCISLDSLVELELAPREILDYLGALAAEGTATILIAGEVGTGKTTLVKALASRIPAEEAILTIEDTHELALNRRFVRTLLTREANTEGSGRISPAEAIRAGMRMAMNRIVLGEMRDAETAEAFIDVCASGHAGMSTIHARSARDALSRLELFLARAQGNVGSDTIRRQIANAVSVVVFLGLDKSARRRRIQEAVEVGTAADGTIQISPMYTYLAGGGLPRWRRDSGISFFRELLTQRGIGFSRTGAELSLGLEQFYHTGTERIKSDLNSRC